MPKPGKTQAAPLQLITGLAINKGGNSLTKGNRLTIW